MLDCEKAEATGGCKSVFECSHVVVVHDHCLVVVVRLSNLILEARLLFGGIDELGVAVAEFASGDNAFEPLRHVRQ